MDRREYLFDNKGFNLLRMFLTVETKIVELSDKDIAWLLTYLVINDYLERDMFTRAVVEGLINKFYPEYDGENIIWHSAGFLDTRKGKIKRCDDAIRLLSEDAMKKQYISKENL